MASSKYFNFGGLDLRSNDLVRPQNKSSDCLNVRLSSRRELIKRFGFDLKDSTALNYLDLIYYGYGDKLLCVTPIGLREWNPVTNSWDAIKYGGSTGGVYTEPVSYAEYNGTLYVADPGLNNYIMKYDGNSFYRAGMPKCEYTVSPSSSFAYTFVDGSVTVSEDSISISGGHDFLGGERIRLTTTGTLPAGLATGTDYWVIPVPSLGTNRIQLADSYNNYVNSVPVNITGAAGGGVHTISFVEGMLYVRVAYQMRDKQGNLTWGDYDQVLLPVGTVITDIIVNQLSTISGFHEGFCKVSSGTLTGGNPTSTITVVAGHTLTIGDTVWYNVDGIDYPLVVTNFDATHVTLDTSNYPFTTVLSSGDILSLTRVGIFTSKNETYGYTLTGVYHLDIDSGTAADRTISDVRHFPENAAMEDFYDTTVVKGLPPKAKYITMFNNIMVAANAIEDVNDAETYEYPNTFFWSDTGVGSTVETFAPFDNQKIGKTAEGEITGVYADIENLILFKEKHGYIINGLLVGAQYRIIRFKSTGIGCVSHKSITEVDGGCFFLSTRGVYVIRYSDTPLELSDIIETIFTENTTLDFTGAIGTLDVRNERFLLYIPGLVIADSIVLEYNYYFKEWFKHNAYDCDGGFIIYDNKIFHNDGVNTFEENTAYDDNTSGINGYYKTGWDNRGNPGLESKFLNAIIYSIGDLAWTATVKTENEWQADIETEEELDFDADISVAQKNLNLNKERALRLTIENNSKQGMLVTGLEVTVEDTQGKIKVEN